MKLTIGKKLGASFGTILLLMTVSALITYSLIVKDEIIQDRIVDQRMKTVLLGKDVINGVNQSLAGLRGYIILGAEPEKAKVMKAVTQEAWNSIDNAMKEYELLARNWTVNANIKRLNDVKSELISFKNAQQEIEKISHSSENIPSYQLLLTDAAPRAAKMLKNITAIIDEESTLEANYERKLLLKSLADTRGTFAIGLANIRAYLLSGNKTFSAKFNEQWKINEASINTINSKQQSLFTIKQQQRWQEFMIVRNEFKTLPSQMFELRSSQDWNIANYWLGTKAAPRANKILSLLTEMEVSQNQLLSNDIEEASSLIKSLESALILMTLTSLILGITASVMFSRDLLTRLGSILTRSKDIADGNMSGSALEVKGKDELSDLTVTINHMSVSLSNLVQETADSMNNASKGTNDILEANQNMASSVQNQTAQIEQIASAVEELSNSSLEVANNCINASDNSASALALARSGGEVVQNASAQIVSIKEAFDSSSKAITSLSSQSREIEDILIIIKGIADQTNLLALNAAIEAARAGEQGRGFAVVADEVRQLAARTTEATSEVESAIVSMNTETKQAVIMMEEGTVKVDKGVEMTNEAATSLSDIIHSVDSMVEKIQAIAATAEEQSMTTAEVAQNTEAASVLSQQVEDGINNVVTLSSTVTNNTKIKAKELLEMV